MGKPVEIPKAAMDALRERPKEGRKIRQINWFDEQTGKLLSTTTGSVKTAFGVGWVMFNKRRVREYCKELPNTSVVVLFYLMAKQTYSEAVQTTWSNVARELGFSTATMTRAAAELKRRHIVRDVTMEGQRAILLNPELTACGRSSLSSRRTLWHLADVMQEITTSRAPMVVNDIEEIRDSPALRRDIDAVADRMSRVDLETGEIKEPELANWHHVDVEELFGTAAPDEDAKGSIGTLDISSNQTTTDINTVGVSADVGGVGAGVGLSVDGINNTIRANTATNVKDSNLDVSNNNRLSGKSNTNTSIDDELLSDGGTTGGGGGRDVGV